MANQSVGSLLSVNVGLPAEVSWHGRTVRTAVWKRPVDGPRMVRRLNIDGDGQGDLGGHGGEHRAVFVYQLDSYRYWQKELHRNDFSYGQFGENFTVEGLTDDRVCIGDRYRIGEAVFEVTQPRVTCYRVGMRMNDPRIPALLVSHHRPGFYLRVISEGPVQAGDDIVKLDTGPETMTVADVSALLYLPGHTPQKLSQALRIRALSDGWKSSFQAMLDEGADPAAGNAGLTKVSPPPAWPGFRPLTVTAVQQESASIVSLRLADPDGAALPPARPGQFLTLGLEVGAGRVLRNYSLSGPPGAGTYRISVKRESHGTASQFIHDQLHSGDQVQVAAPRGSFLLEPGTAPVLLISAGVGATPVLAMLHALAEAGSQQVVWWIHGARSRADEPFAEESRSLLAALANGHRQISYSRPGPDDVLGRDYQSTGRLSLELLAGLDLPGEAAAYICGPTAFMAEMSSALGELGLDGTRVHTELFGARAGQTPGIKAATRPPHTIPGPAGGGPSIAFARSGVTVRWDGSSTTLLELAEACDVPVRWSCRTGVCRTCETTLISGAVGYDPEPVDTPAEGSALICCSRPRSDLVLDL
jgi:ferredoxin-NADP reductase/MOSC domain-containing protein YiiM